MKLDDASIMHSSLSGGMFARRKDRWKRASRLFVKNEVSPLPLGFWLRITATCSFFGLHIFNIADSHLNRIK
jgi:hypothetical protein